MYIYSNKLYAWWSNKRKWFISKRGNTCLIRLYGVHKSFSFKFVLEKNRMEKLILILRYLLCNLQWVFHYYQVWKVWIWHLNLHQFWHKIIIDWENFKYINSIYQWVLVESTCRPWILLLTLSIRNKYTGSLKVYLFRLWMKGKCLSGLLTLDISCKLKVYFLIFPNWNNRNAKRLVFFSFWWSVQNLDKIGNVVEKWSKMLISCFWQNTYIGWDSIVYHRYQSVWELLPHTNFELNCPCHLYGSIHHRMHNW